MQALYPQIDENIPIPKRSSRNLELNTHDEIRVRATTIKYISDISGEPVIPDSDDQVGAEVLAHQMVTDPDSKPDFSRYSNSTMAWLAGLVAQSNVQLVDELSELKMYVVNKLLYIAEDVNSSTKERLAAISKLGEVDGVDAFKKRSETTITVKPIEEVEKELLNVLDNIEYSVLDYDSNEETKPEDENEDEGEPDGEYN